LTSLVTVSFSRKTLLHGVSQLLGAKRQSKRKINDDCGNASISVFSEDSTTSRFMMLHF